MPILENDGRPLDVAVSGNIARTSFKKQGDSQNFISLDPNASFGIEPERILSSYGWLRPVRVVSDESTNTIFVYPQGTGDPAAREVLNSFSVTPNGFRSAFSRVEGNLYFGRTSAGGESDRADLDEDGIDDFVFDRKCAFIIQLRGGRPIAVEADRNVTMTRGGKKTQLQSYTPLIFEH